MKLEKNRFYLTKNGIVMYCKKANEQTYRMFIGGYVARMISVPYDKERIGTYDYQGHDGKYMIGIESGLDIEREISEDEALAIAALNG